MNWYHIPSSSCLFQVWAGGGGGGGAQAGAALVPGFPNSKENASGGGGGGGGGYVAILIKNKNLLNGFATFATTIGAGGIGQLAGSPTYDGGVGGYSELRISGSGLDVTFRVQGGKGGQGGTLSLTQGNGGDGGVGLISPTSFSTSDFEICESRSYGGGGGIFQHSNANFGGAGGLGYRFNTPGGIIYNGSAGNSPLNNLPGEGTRAGFGGGMNGVRGGECNYVIDTYLNGAGSGGSDGSVSPPLDSTAGSHPYTGPGAGAGFNNSELLRAHHPVPGSIGSGGGGGVGGRPGLSVAGAAASNGGPGLVKILYNL